MLQQFLPVLVLAISICAIVPANSQAINCQSDGQLDINEECDDNNTIANDGCTQCTLDPIQLDFNSSASAGVQYSIEFFELDQVVFFADPSILRFNVTPSDLRLTRIIILMVGNDPDVRDTIDVETAEAFSQGRTTTDFTGFFDRNPLRPEDPRLVGLDTFIDTSLVTQGMIVNGDSNSRLFGGDNDNLLSFSEAEAVLITAGYTANTHPGFNPREFCIILTDDVDATTTSCITLYFIGRNDDPPVVLYDSVGVASFVEGGVNFVPITQGTISVTDADHPRYLQTSAQARIVGFTAGYPEYLGVTSQHPDFTYAYDPSTGTLSITGEATPEVYTMLLSNLTYFNNMSEPIGNSRQFELTVFDGVFNSQPALVMISINNTNDPPALSLDGEDPVITTLSVDYVEGSGSVEVAPNLVVVDVDPNAMIQRVTVWLSNPQDVAMERLGISTTNTMGIDLQMSDHRIQFTGVFPSSVYTSVVRSVTYQHLDANPGNPTTSQVRMIEFEVEDSSGAASVQNSILQLSILPVNDPPFLFFISSEVLRSFPIPVTSGSTREEFRYTEDDQPLNFGRDIYLRDVDSNINSALISVENLLNGVEDVVSMDSDLLESYNISLTSEESENVTARMIRLAGEATPIAYEMVLRSLTYQNLHSTNRLTDGTRTIRVTVNDTQLLGSSLEDIVATIDVGDRNDAPSVNLGAGEGMTLNITFVENGASVPIVLPHLVSIMDEEDHNISRLTAQLVATNGQLDPSDAIFLRSPLALQFIDDFRTPPNTTFLDIALNETAATYTDALLSIYYDNDEVEPTLFNSDGSLLNREIVITVYDNNFLTAGQSIVENSNFDDDFGVSRIMARVRIMIDPINDNRPRILIRAEPDGCGLSSVEVDDADEGVVRRRRDVRAANARMKRAIRVDSSKAPALASVHATFTSSDDQQCLDSVTISFASNTSAPIAELSGKLDALLSFDWPELRASRRFGRWFDPSTLVVVFSECPALGGGDSDGKERPMYITFEAERGDCNTATTCDNATICFGNKTGCPVAGSYRVNVNNPCKAGERCPAEKGQEVATPKPEDNVAASYDVIMMLLLVVMLLAFFIGISVRCGSMFRNNSKHHIHSPSLHPTIIDMTPASTKEQNPPMVATKPGPEKNSYAKTTPTKSTPPPRYKPRDERESATPLGAISEDARKRRRKGKRRAQKDKESSQEDEELLLSQQSLGDEEAPVTTLLPLGRSHDMSCDLTAAPSGCTQSQSVGVAESQSDPASTRELLLNFDLHSVEEGCVACSGPTTDREQLITH